MPPQEVSWTIEAEATIAKAADGDDGECRVFGWASIIEQKSGDPLVDRQGDVMLLEDLEPAVYQFVIDFHAGGVMHRGGVTSKLIESFVVTPDKLKAMGFKANALRAGWWVGFSVEDQAIAAKVRAGNFKAFSIQGKGTRTPIKEGDAP